MNADEPAILGLSASNPIAANLFSYCNNNSVNNIDPTGCFSMRTILIADIIDLILMLIPAVGSLNNMFKKLRAGGKLTQVEMGVWERTFTLIAEKTVSKIGLKRAIALTIVSTINSAIRIISDFSIGNLVVWALKLIFSTEIRYERMFYWFGKKKNYEYIIF